MPTLLGHIKQGKVRALAVTSAKRVDDLPDGTFREAGTSVRTSLVVVDAPALGGAWA